MKDPEGACSVEAAVPAAQGLWAAKWFGTTVPASVEA